jgi:hypothetical protein
VAASLSSSAASAAYVDAYQDHNWRAFAVDIAVTLGGGGLAERKFESYLVDRAVKDAAKQNVQLLFTPSAWVAEQVLVYVGTR